MTIDNFKKLLYDIADEVEKSRDSPSVEANSELNPEDYIAGFLDGNNYFAEYMARFVKEIADNIENYAECFEL